jgi:hypothetical protein
VSVPLRLRERKKSVGFAGSASTSSVSWTPLGTVLSILLSSTAHVALKNVFDAASLEFLVSVDGSRPSKSPNVRRHGDIAVTREDAGV